MVPIRKLQYKPYVVSKNAAKIVYHLICKNNRQVGATSFRSRADRFPDCRLAAILQRSLRVLTLWYLNKVGLPSSAVAPGRRTSCQLELDWVVHLNRCRKTKCPVRARMGKIPLVICRADEGR